MHRIFSGDGWLVFPDILKSAHDHCPSQRLLQQPPVLIILCILCIDVQFIVLLDGSAQSRGAGARLAGKRESMVARRIPPTSPSPNGDRPAFREVARRTAPTAPSGRHPRERGRPARILSLWPPLSSSAMLQAATLSAGTTSARLKEQACPWGCSRSSAIPVGGDGRGFTLSAGTTSASFSSLKERHGVVPA